MILPDLSLETKNNDMIGLPQVQMFDSQSVKVTGTMSNFCSHKNKNGTHSALFKNSFEQLLFWKTETKIILILFRNDFQISQH